ncbi:MAG TPA: bifunctional adenosylcobinamide kinase/adenosylcobinamide-phosphate guanylyltransferase [Kofleriaceae bacterium]|nr:bifunctional adenosylcobinamide kinase/adenosylcobinamide-phosphate guanylyltransferase [Kofleriaceae bacterium]
MAYLILIGGGARSGKSSLALALARERDSPCAFVATAEASDDEMRARIARHVREREARFRTCEVPLALAPALAGLAEELVVIDCLTLWLSNLLCAGAGEDEIDTRVTELVGVIADRPGQVLVVTNEVGLGIVPEHALGRRFRDVAGRTHQRLAAAADEVYFGALGIMLRIKPAPVEPVAH